MPIRLRKFIGLIVMLVWIFLYALLAMGIAGHVLPGAGGLVQLLYYAAAGLAWIVPMKPLFTWMSRPDKSP